MQIRKTFMEDIIFNFITETLLETSLITIEILREAKREAPGWLSHLGVGLLI